MVQKKTRARTGFRAQLLNGRSDPVFSPWFQRRSDYVRLTADLVDLVSGASLEVRLYTKSRQQAGSGTEVDSGTRITLSSSGRSTAEWGPRTGSGLKELVRYRFENTTTTPTAWLIFRMLNASWFDAVRAN